jgi:hypothetical protein
MTIERKDWIWWGQAAHLIVAHECRFHLATQVGIVVVSTVGAWKQDQMNEAMKHETAAKRAEWEAHRKRAVQLGMERKDGSHQIGAWRFYESMVFPIVGYCTETECDCGGLPDIGAASSVGFSPYNFALEAQAGHVDLCVEWSSDEKQAEAKRQLERYAEAKRRGIDVWDLEDADASS